MDPLLRPPIVLDTGSATLKAGLAGERSPRVVLPSIVRCPAPTVAEYALADLDVAVGKEAFGRPAYAVSYPLKHGLVVDWDGAEKLWSAAIYRHLRLLPQEQPVILSEPPRNPPENREAMAEVFFETFDVPGLHIENQALLALFASFAAAETLSQSGQSSLTGVVVDVGEGTTHVTPISHGFVLGSFIEAMPLAGSAVTAYVQQLIRERGEPIPQEELEEAAKAIKEQYCYVCGNAEKEAAKYEQQPEKYRRRFQGTHARTGQPFVTEVKDERYLGPEILFQPALASSTHSTPLPGLIDSVVQSCPIDTRRELYGNIVLSGGSTLFRDFGRRIQRDVKLLADARTHGAASELEVHVHTHAARGHAVWLGGSLLGVSDGFAKLAVTRAQYQEHGPSIARSSTRDAVAR